jgi:hypothetical protein
MEGEVKGHGVTLERQRPDVTSLCGSSSE